MPTTPETTFPHTLRLDYGTANEQFGDLTLPSDDPAPVVVLIHGGFWRNPYGLQLMEPLAADLVERGYAVWNIEYRRLGDDGGGWPGTLTDVADAIDHLATLTPPVETDRVAFVGHSAGGHLALWAAGRTALPSDAPGANPVISPLIAIGQGAVVDIQAAATARLGSGAVDELLGGEASTFPERFLWATPSLGTGPIMVSVVGTADDVVPPSFSADPRQAGDVALVEIDDADHFDLINPIHAAWAAVVQQLDQAFGSRA